MREYRRASFQELYEASESGDIEFVDSVQTLLEAGGLTPVVVKNRKGQEVLSVKREWVQGDTSIKKLSWQQMVNEAFDSGRMLYDYLMNKLTSNKKGSTAEIQSDFRKAGEARTHLDNIKPYL